VKQQYTVWIATDDNFQPIAERKMFLSTTDRHRAWEAAKTIHGVITVATEYEPNELDDYVEMF